MKGCLPSIYSGWFWQGLSIYCHKLRMQSRITGNIQKINKIPRILQEWEIFEKKKKIWIFPHEAKGFIIRTNRSLFSLISLILSSAV
jgi:hypothetical protein